jgi:leader peptidase (prepilin peptidase) / N-methyltransferase
MIEINHYFGYVIVLLAGLAIGSFLNVLIYRFPREESIVFPASHCPQCLSTIKYRDNIPVMGYLLLGGRCRVCKMSIPLQYPLIELVTASFFVVLYSFYGFTGNFFSDAVLTSILLVALVIDLHTMLIPDKLTFPGSIIGLAFSLRFGWHGLLRAFEGALIGLVILFIMSLLGKILYKRESMGWGDYKLITVTGFFLGPLWNGIALVLSITIGGLWGMIQLVSGKKEGKDEIPFAPFIAVGCFLVILFRKQIMVFLMHFVL